MVSPCRTNCCRLLRPGRIVARPRALLLGRLHGLRSLARAHAALPLVHRRGVCVDDVLLAVFDLELLAADRALHLLGALDGLLADADLFAHVGLLLDLRGLLHHRHVDRLALAQLAARRRLAAARRALDHHALLAQRHVDGLLTLGNAL